MRAKSARPVAVLALAAGVVFGATIASAHSSLVSSTPEDGAVLTEAPHEVVLEFDDELLPDFSQVAVIDEAENHYEDGEPGIAGTTLTQALTALPSGQYTISYRVGSGDGHPVTGAVVFTVDAPGADVAADEPAAQGDESAAADTSGDLDEDAAPLGTIAMAVVAVALVGAAGLLMARRRSADHGASPGGS
jgi:hypothetical protein